MKNFKYFELLFLTAILVLTFSDAAAKTYHRKCSAWYEVTVFVVDGIPVDMSPEEVTPSFSGRGKCGPYTRINDCRRRARDFCHTCMKEHWTNPSTRPSACTYYAGGVGVQNYNIDDLTLTLGRAACGVSNFRNGAIVTYKVFRVTKGNKGCGGGTNKMMREELNRLTSECVLPPLIPARPPEDL